MSDSEIDLLRPSMQSVISTTLDQTIYYHFEPASGRVLPPHDYGGFAHLIRDLGAHRTTVITFNYDFALDFAFMSAQVPVDYCLAEARPNTYAEAAFNAPLPFLKLHGSLNWTKCSICDAIVRLDGWPEPEPLEDDERLVRLKCAKHRLLRTHCNKPVLPEPVIVPPTWDKTEYRSRLAFVWQRAARELSRATDIFVSGYSLPETDSFFKYLYAIGSVGEQLLRRFYVFDPDPAVHDRFRALLGRGAHAAFREHRVSFNTAVNQIGSELTHKPYV